MVEEKSTLKCVIYLMFKKMWTKEEEDDTWNTLESFYILKEQNVHVFKYHNIQFNKKTVCSVLTKNILLHVKIPFSTLLTLFVYSLYLLLYYLFILYYFFVLDNSCG